MLLVVTQRSRTDRELLKVQDRILTDVGGVGQRIECRPNNVFIDASGCFSRTAAKSAFGFMPGADTARSVVTMN